jgi:hypothetical protein
MAVLELGESSKDGIKRERRSRRRKAVWMKRYNVIVEQTLFELPEVERRSGPNPWDKK